MPDVTACPICGGTRLSPYLETRDFHLTQEVFTLKKCEGCGLILTSPRPDTAHLMKYYDSYDYISHTASGTNIVNQAYLIARKFTLRQKLNLVETFCSKGKILDFGCGTGEFLRYARKRYWDTYGVEPAENARNAARQALPNVHADILSIPAQHVDVITLWHVLEHVPQLNETLAQLNERLVEGGTILIAVPNVNSYDSQHYGSHWAGLDVPRHLWHFSQPNLVSLLHNHRFKWVQTLPMKLDAYYVSLLSEKYRLHNKLSPAVVYKAIRSGLKSNIKARRSTEYSSLIYVARK